MITSSELDKLTFESSLRELEDYLIGNKSNLGDFIIFINDKYYTEVKNALISNLKGIEDNIQIRLISNYLIEDNQLAIIVNKKALDWGNFYFGRL